jgi:hypothetical protein
LEFFFKIKPHFIKKHQNTEGGIGDIELSKIMF